MNTRRKLVQIFMVLTLLVFIFLYFIVSDSIASEIVLKFAEHLPPTHQVSIDGMQYLIKRIEKLTDGKVKVQHFPSGQLGQPRDMLTHAKTGVADMTLVVPGYIPGLMPLSGVGELPGLYKNGIVGSDAFSKIIQEQGTLYIQEIKRNNVYPLACTILPQYEVMTLKKPVKILQDMAGLKLRAGGGAMGKTISLMGAVPILMPPPELYEALQRGTIDGAIYTYGSAKAYRLQELIKYGTVGANLGGLAVYYFINEKRWQNLPSDIKKAMKQAGDETIKHLAKSADEFEKNEREVWRKGGVELHYLSPNEQKEWSAKIMPVIEDWVNEMTKKGLPGQKVLDEFKKAIQEVK